MSGLFSAHFHLFQPQKDLVLTTLKERRIKQKYQIPVERMTLTACLRSITISQNYSGFIYRIILLPADNEDMLLLFPISLNLINLLPIFDPDTSFKMQFFFHFCRSAKSTGCSTLKETSLCLHEKRSRSAQNNGKDITLKNKTSI